MEAWCGVKTATFHSAVLCMDLSNVAGTEWEEISATSFQNLENHSTKLDAIILMVIISDALIYSICIGQY